MVSNLISSDRKQYVSVDGVSSSHSELKYGVPQESCLGPLLFTLYTSPLFKLIKEHLDLTSTAMLTTRSSISPSNQSPKLLRGHALGEIEACVSDICDWFLANKHQWVKDGISLSSELDSSLSKINYYGISIGNSEVMPSEALKDLGVWLDNTLSMSKHVTKLASSYYSSYTYIWRIRKYLSKSACETPITPWLYIDWTTATAFFRPSCQTSLTTPTCPKQCS